MQFYYFIFIFYYYYFYYYYKLISPNLYPVVFSYILNKHLHADV